MTTLIVTETDDFTGDPLANINSIEFSTSASSIATFSAGQFGPGLISDSVAITGDANSNAIVVKLPAGSTSFSAAGWTFASWSDTGDSVTIHGEGDQDFITGSSREDIIYGYEGADVLSGGGGDDFFFGGVGHDQLAGGTATTSMSSPTPLNPSPQARLSTTAYRKRWAKATTTASMCSSRKI